MLCASLYANIGKILIVKGDASVTRGGKDIKAKNGMSLQQKDTITTQNRTKLQIKFKDGTVIRIGKNSKFDIEEYKYDKTKNSKLTVKVKRGIFKAFTGKIGKVARNNFKLKTRTATCGIRGTIFGGLVDPVEEVITVEDGGISLTTDAGSVDVNKGEFSTIMNGGIPATPQETTLAVMNKIKKGSKRNQAAAKKENQEKKKKEKSKKQAAKKEASKKEAAKKEPAKKQEAKKQESKSQPKAKAQDKPKPKAKAGNTPPPPKKAGGTPPPPPPSDDGDNPPPPPPPPKVDDPSADENSKKINDLIDKKKEEIATPKEDVVLNLDKQMQTSSSDDRLQLAYVLKSTTKVEYVEVSDDAPNGYIITTENGKKYTDVNSLPLSEFKQDQRAGLADTILLPELPTADNSDTDADTGSTDTDTNKNNIKPTEQSVLDAKKSAAPYWKKTTSSGQSNTKTLSVYANNVKVVGSASHTGSTNQLLKTNSTARVIVDNSTQQSGAELLLNTDKKVQVVQYVQSGDTTVPVTTIVTQNRAAHINLVTGDNRVDGKVTAIGNKVDNSAYGVKEDAKANSNITYFGTNAEQIAVNFDVGLNQDTNDAQYKGIAVVNHTQDIVLNANTLQNDGYLFDWGYWQNGSLKFGAHIDASTHLKELTASNVASYINANSNTKAGYTGNVYGTIYSSGAINYVTSGKIFLEFTFANTKPVTGQLSFLQNSSKWDFDVNGNIKADNSGFVLDTFAARAGSNKQLLKASGEGVFHGPTVDKIDALTGGILMTSTDGDVVTAAFGASKQAYAKVANTQSTSTTYGFKVKDAVVLNDKIQSYDGTTLAPTTIDNDSVRNYLTSDDDSRFYDIWVDKSKVSQTAVSTMNAKLDSNPRWYGVGTKVFAKYEGKLIGTAYFSSNQEKRLLTNSTVSLFINYRDKESMSNVSMQHQDAESSNPAVSSTQLVLTTKDKTDVTNTSISSTNVSSSTTTSGSTAIAGKSTVASNELKYYNPNANEVIGEIETTFTKDSDTQNGVTIKGVYNLVKTEEVTLSANNMGNSNGLFDWGYWSQHSFSSAKDYSKIAPANIIGAWVRPTFMSETPTSYVDSQLGQSVPNVTYRGNIFGTFNTATGAFATQNHFIINGNIELVFNLATSSLGGNIHFDTNGTKYRYSTTGSIYNNRFEFGNFQAITDNQATITGGSGDGRMYGNSMESVAGGFRMLNSNNNSEINAAFTGLDDTKIVTENSNISTGSEPLAVDWGYIKDASNNYLSLRNSKFFDTWVDTTKIGTATLSNRGAGTTGWYSTSTSNIKKIAFYQNPNGILGNSYNRDGGSKSMYNTNSSSSFLIDYSRGSTYGNVVAESDDTVSINVSMTNNSVNHNGSSSATVLATSTNQADYNDSFSSSKFSHQLYGENAEQLIGTMDTTYTKTHKTNSSSNTSDHHMVFAAAKVYEKSLKAKQIANDGFFSWGYWADIAGTMSNDVASVQSGYATGAWVNSSEARTANSVIYNYRVQSVQASYNGNVYGTVHSGDFSSRNMIDNGNISLNMNFGTSTMSGNINFDEVDAANTSTRWSADISGSINPSSNGFNITSFSTKTGDSVANISGGSGNGLFVGANAEGAMGGFEINSDRGVAIGAFTAKK
jgi:hypothetical protein